MAPTKAKGGATAASRKNVVFIHPDLGIGGAERLIVDAAVGLQELGHKVTIFTSHCDPRHCFEEARDGTLDVRVRGNTIFPSTVLNRFHILLATLRQIHLVLAIAFFSDELRTLRPDAFIVDQLSACIPLLRWLYSRKRTLFYCHFPDQLLADRKTTGILGMLKNAYRRPFDWFEGWSMGACDKIVVNSNFTKSVASKTFPGLSSSFGVIYPCVSDKPSRSPPESTSLWDGKLKLLLSINRFERKKDIGLAIRAYKGLSAVERQGTRLVLAGGYDNRVSENVEYHKELVQLAEESGLLTATVKTVPTALGIPDDIQVLFLLSIPGAFKNTLLQNAILLLYTPSNEHFGIVPVEAMQYGVPVLASNTGGPVETIVEGETGWLRGVERVSEWTEVIKRSLSKSETPARKAMGEAGQRRVQKHFTRSTMAHKFENEINSMLKDKRSPFIEGSELGIILGVVAAFVAALLATMIRKYMNSGGDPRLTEFARARRTASESGYNLGFVPMNDRM